MCPKIHIVGIERGHHRFNVSNGPLNRLVKIFHRALAN